MRTSILIFLAGVTLFGCSRQEPATEPSAVKTERVEPGVQPETAATTPATDRVDRVMGSAESFQGRAVADQTGNIDTRLTDGIRTAISTLSGAANVTVTVSEGKATLAGSVNTEQEKSAIGETARGVMGVREVDNQIEVKSSAPVPAPSETPMPAPSESPAPTAQ
jgi:osmotically-inducible protein OsmY